MADHQGVLLATCSDAAAYAALRASVGADRKLVSVSADAAGEVRIKGRLSEGRGGLRRGVRERGVRERGRSVGARLFFVARFSNPLALSAAPFSPLLAPLAAFLSPLRCT